jgi:ketosteroid isomerase-like protein
MMNIMKFIDRRVAYESHRIFCCMMVISVAFLLLMSLPSIAQTETGLSEADVKKINEINQIAMKAAVSQDFATWSAIFLEDAVIYPPNQAAVIGRSAIRAWLEKSPSITQFTLNNEKVEGREDLAYVRGTYTMTLTPPNSSEPVKDIGKYVTVLRRQPDGSWLCVVDMFSSDLPAAPPK